MVVNPTRVTGSCCGRTDHNRPPPTHATRASGVHGGWPTGSTCIDHRAPASSLVRARAEARRRRGQDIRPDPRRTRSPATSWYASAPLRLCAIDLRSEAASVPRRTTNPSFCSRGVSQVPPRLESPPGDEPLSISRPWPLAAVGRTFDRPRGTVGVVGSILRSRGSSARRARSRRQPADPDRRWQPIDRSIRATWP